MTRANELKKGQAIVFNNDIHVVVDSEHVAKGNKRSYYQMKLRNVKTGQLVDERFRVDDDVELAFLDRRRMEYLYSDGSGHVMMDMENYEQLSIPDDIIGDGKLYLTPNMEVEVVMYEGSIVSLDLPHTVNLKVTDTPPVVKGATATNQYKDATLETGLEIKVPPFIESDETVKVDTRSGEYVERVK